MHSPARRSTLVLVSLALIAFGMVLPQAAGFAVVQRAVDRTDQVIQVLAAPISGPNKHSPWRQWLPATFSRRHD